jgi:hypothetical protein
MLFFQSFAEVKSQTPDWEWARSAANYATATPPAGEGWDMVTDSMGYIYAGGWFSDDSLDFGPFTIYGQHTNGYDVFIAKYDSTGNVLWVKGSRGTGIHICYGISIDPSDNLYITGLFENKIIFDNDTLNTNGDNIFLAKYDSAGNFLWARKAKGTALNALSSSVSCDPFGNVYITGFFGSTIIFGSDTLISLGGSDVFTVKYNSMGNVLWARNGKGTGSDVSSSVTTDLTGNAFITGYFSSPQFIFNTDTLFTPFQSVFIVKYDSSGNVTLAESSKGGGGNYGNSIITSAQGNIYATGSYNSFPIIFGSDTLFPGGGTFDGYLVKYDLSGNVLWAKSFWGGKPYKIILDSMENTYMTGGMGGNPGVPVIFDTFTLQLPTGFTDPMFIAKFDSSGNVIWAKALQSGGDDHSGIALGANGSIYITSDFYNIDPFILGCDSLILTGQEDFFIAKLGHNLCDSTVAVNENYQTITVHLFPNPVISDLNVETAYNHQLEIILYDITSRKLLQQTFTNAVTLNTSQLAKGIYIYEVRNKDGVVKKGKVVKE